jgi:N-methylhydantoinase B/oxoprolinase/acetone carboxylase alpha subunit
MTSKVDPITFEVLRHRLWMINDEQGKVASQISGSPVVYESKDFNSALLTAEGDSLFIGIYCTRLSLCLDVAVKTVMERFSDDPGIEDGDAFITNDPWAGASHMNDIVMVAPVFFGGRVIAWTGLTMHEIDVGGGNPGSFTIGNRDVFGEGPIISPVKLVERGRFRPDIEAWAIRNSRTAQVNALTGAGSMRSSRNTAKRPSWACRIESLNLPCGRSSAVCVPCPMAPGWKRAFWTMTATETRFTASAWP